MSLEIKPYTADWEEAVGDFNRRLKEKGVTFQFPKSCVSIWLPKIGDRKIYQEFFLAVENNSTIRGGYVLKHHNVSLGGKITLVCEYQLPLSEGIINRAHKAVGHHLLQSAIEQQRLLFSLGMGGLDKPLPKALKRKEWNLQPIPFYFRVVQPVNFLRNIMVLRTSKIRRMALDFLAVSGIGWAVIKLYQAVRSRRAVPKDTLRVEPVSNFDDWADIIWNRTKDSYRLATVRDSKTLNILYPKSDNRFIRLRLLENQQTVGWVVGLNTKMTKHKQFGKMRVGSIIDCLALPGYETDVVAAITRILLDGGVDIIVSNQSYVSWCLALKKSGFVRGPSNFAFAVSPELARILGPLKQNIPEIHINRGDGGGPINL